MGVSRLHIQSFMLIFFLIAKPVVLPILTITVVLPVIIVETVKLASLFIAAAWSFFTASPTAANEIQVAALPTQSDNIRRQEML